MLRFHWFLPTNGDGRDIVGGGHGVATGAAGAIRPATVKYLGQIARSAEQLGFEAALTPTGTWCEDAWLTTAMLVEVTRAAEVPRRLPARADLADAVGADGGHVPAAFGRAVAAQRRDRGRVRGAARLRRLPIEGRQVRALRGVPGHRLAALERADGDLCGGSPACRGRAAGAAARPGARTVLRRLLRGRGTGGDQVQRRVPDLGRAAPGGGLQATLDGRPGPRGRADAALRHPAARDLAGHLRAGVAAGPPADRRGRRGDHTEGPVRPRPQRVGGAAPDA